MKRFLQNLQSFISKSMDVTSQIFISLWKSISQYLLHPCDFESPALTPHWNWGDEIVEQGQPPSLTAWSSSTAFVKLGTCGLTGCPFHASLGSSLKHCQQPTAQVTVSSTLPLPEGAQYSFVVHIKHKITQSRQQNFTSSLLSLREAADLNFPRAPLPAAQQKSGITQNVAKGTPSFSDN